jgi:hypothetical protein
MLDFLPDFDSSDLARLERNAQKKRYLGGHLPPAVVCDSYQKLSRTAGVGCQAGDGRGVFGQCGVPEERD